MKDEKMGCTYNNTKTKVADFEYLISTNFNCEGDYCNSGAVDQKTGKIEGADCKSEEEKKKESGASSSSVIQGGIFILIASVSMISAII
jgi:hypothetical protein